MPENRQLIDLSLISKLVNKVVAQLADGKVVTYQIAFLVPLEHRLRIECTVDGELHTKEIDLVEFFA